MCHFLEKRLLIKFNEMHETELEIQESIDMLRLIENDFKVRLIPINQISQPIDSPEDVKVVEKLICK